MKNKDLRKALIAYGISVAALVCAALNMLISRNMLKTEDTSVEE